MIDTKNYIKNIEKYTEKVNEKMIDKLALRLAATMTNPDAKFVACDDKKELARVRRNFIYSKLGVNNLEKANQAMENVCQKMKSCGKKNRLTFYYLVAEDLKKIGAYLKA